MGVEAISQRAALREPHRKNVLFSTLLTIAHQILTGQERSPVSEGAVTYSLRFVVKYNHNKKQLIAHLGQQERNTCL
jgi:hypothetical protein